MCFQKCPEIWTSGLPDAFWQYPQTVVPQPLASSTMNGIAPANRPGMTTLPFSRATAGKINRWWLALLAAGILAAGSSASAQGMPRGLPQGIPRGIPRQQPGIPPAYLPPAGMCRIWIEGVPAGHQPAPTDCVTAVRNRPVNGYVVFGDQSPRRGNDKPKKGKSGKERRDISSFFEEIK